MQTIEAFFNAITQLPTLPKVVQEVIQTLNQDNVSLRDLASKVEHDAVIAAKVLQMANSPYYGVTRSVKTVDDAIAILGLSKLQSLVIASGVVGSVPAIAGFNLKNFWCHSLVTAGVSRGLARLAKEEAEIAYVSGLLHHIGWLLMSMVYPEQAAEVASSDQALNVEQKQALEQQTFGFTHSQVSEALARRWDFPTEISRVLRFYATPLQKEANATALIVYIAAHIAHGLMNDEAPDAILESLGEGFAETSHLDRVQLVTEIEAYRGLVAEAEALI